MKLPFTLGLVALMIISLAFSASAYEILGQPTQIAFRSDGTFTEYSGSTALEAGADVSPITWILIRNDDGTYEYIPQTFSSPLESGSIIRLTTCEDGCEDEIALVIANINELKDQVKYYSSRNPIYAITYAAQLQKEILKLEELREEAERNDPEDQCWDDFESYCANQGKDVDRAYCSDGWCKGNCLEAYDQYDECDDDSDCPHATGCAYGCEIEPPECTSNNRCISGRCGSAVECGVGCTSDSDAIKKCKDIHSDSSTSIKSASCDKDGNIVCIPMSKGTIECTKDAGCKDKMEAACVEGSTFYKCSTSTNCDGAIMSAECSWNCIDSTTSKYICGDGTCNGGETLQTCSADCKSSTDPTAICGNGACEAGETEIKCPLDCGVVKENTLLILIEKLKSLSDYSNTLSEEIETAETDEEKNYFEGLLDTLIEKRKEIEDLKNSIEQTSDDCTLGFIGERYCKGGSLVKTYQYATCATVVKELEKCNFGCEDGACLTEVKDPEGYCGDTICDMTIESKATCSIDCGVATYDDYFCGDDECNAGEDSTICPQDCKTVIDDIIGAGTEDSSVIIGGILLVILVGGLIFFMVRKQ